MIPEEDLLAEIKRLADGDSPPTRREFRQNAKYSAKTVARRFGSWWQAVVLAGLSPRRRRPLTSAQFCRFFDAARGQQQAKYELIALLSQFTGLTRRLIPRLDKSWLMERPGGVVVQVPADQTRSGDRWTFKLPGSWSDNGSRRATGLPGLLKWYLDQYGSICDSNNALMRSIFRVAADAGLSSRERTTESELGTVPLVRPSDLRATGGVRMAHNGAPARRIRRHLGIEHTGWKADVEDFFVWCAVRDKEFFHPDWEPSEAVQKALEWVSSSTHLR